MAGAFTSSESTITASPSAEAANAFNRDSFTIFTPRVTRPETVFINTIGGGARNGFNWRVPATGVINSAGATVNVGEFTSLSLVGMGVAAIRLPGTSLPFALSVSEP